LGPTRWVRQRLFKMASALRVRSSDTLASLMAWARLLAAGLSVFRSASASVTPACPASAFKLGSLRKALMASAAFGSAPKRRPTAAASSPHPAWLISWLPERLAGARRRVLCRRIAPAARWPGLPARCGRAWCGDPRQPPTGPWSRRKSGQFGPAPEWRRPLISSLLLPGEARHPRSAPLAPLSWRGTSKSGAQLLRAGWRIASGQMELLGGSRTFAAARWADRTCKAAAGTGSFSPPAQPDRPSNAGGRCPSLRGRHMRRAGLLRGASRRT